MSISIYYEARRSQPLTKSEEALVKVIVNVGSVDRKIQEYLETGDGVNWESFTLYEQPTSPDHIIEGATRLPDNTNDALWEGLQHWCLVLTLLRLVLHDADWNVSVDDHSIVWDEEQKRYDPSI